MSFELCVQEDTETTSRNIGIKTRFGRNMTAHQCLQTNLIHKVYFRHPDRCTQTISDKQVRQKTKVLAKSYVSKIPTEANIQNNQNTGSLHTKTDETKRHSKQHNCQRQTTTSKQTRLKRKLGNQQTEKKGGGYIQLQWPMWKAEQTPNSQAKIS